MAATIETLADEGYRRTSFAQIAKRAQISASLIPYHFANKDELIAHTLEGIATGWDAYVEQQVVTGASAGQRLERYIQASLAYMGTRPTHFAALIEIAFNARTPDGKLMYRSDEDDTGLTLLVSILEQGQQDGEFRAFDPRRMAIAIRGAINEFFGAMHKPGVAVEPYADDLIGIFRRAVAR